MASGSASSRGASQPTERFLLFFDYTELEQKEEEAPRNNAILVRHVLNGTYCAAARSFESRSSSGGSWMLFPAAAEYAASAERSSGSVTLCVSSSSSSGNYWSSEVCERERSGGHAPTTLGAQSSGALQPAAERTEERSHPSDRSLTKLIKLRQHLRKELKQFPVEPAAVTFRGTTGTVELTESELVVSPPRLRARSTPVIRGPTWQQGGEADLAAITARRQLKKHSGERNTVTQGAGVAPAQNLPWAPRQGRTGLGAATW